MSDTFDFLHDLTLSDAHETLLLASAVSPLRVMERGYVSIPSASAPDGSLAASLTDAGVAPAHVRHALLKGALVIPVRDCEGDVVSFQLRGDVPFPSKDGKPFRYTGPKVGVRLDFGPTAHDLDAPLWITEGVKKADALASLGLRAVSIPGVWNFKQNGAVHSDLTEGLPKGMRVRIVFDADTADKPRVAQSQERLFHWLKTQKQADVSVAVLPGRVGDTVVKGVDDHLAAGFTLEDLEGCLTTECPRYTDVAAVAKANETLAKVSAGTNPEDVVTDARMGAMLAGELFPGRFRWVNGAGWAHWDGSRWVIDGKNDKPVNDAVRLFLEAWFKARVTEANESGSARSREGLRDLNVYRSVLSRTKRDAMIRDASAVDGVLCQLTDFDSDADVLNTPSGLLDLRTGAVAPRDPRALVTKLTGVDHRPGAASPLWDSILSAVPEAARDWMQLRLGEALFGHITHDAGAMFWLGGGGNGKSTLLEAVMTVMGDYAGVVPPKLIAGNPSDHPTEIMSLRGLRLAVVEELPEGKILNVTALKRIQGVSRVTARLMYQDNTTFRLSHALIVASNYEPIVTETDDGTWRRLVRVPFPFRFTRTPNPEHAEERAGDPSIGNRFRADATAREALFAWMVDGAIRYYRDYLSQGRSVEHAPVVEAACETWRRNADPTYMFASDLLVWDPSGTVASADLLGAYNAFLATQGMNKVSARTLKDRILATAAQSGHARTVSGPVPVWMSADRLSRPPAFLGVESSATATAGNPFKGGADGPETTPMTHRVYKGLRFRTDADDASDNEREAASAASLEVDSLMTEVELITVTAAATGNAFDPDHDHGAGVCVEDGCDDRRARVLDSNDHLVYADRCDDHARWCGWDDTCGSLSSGGSGLCAAHLIEERNAKEAERMEAERMAPIDAARAALAYAEASGDEDEITRCRDAYTELMLRF